MENKNIRPIIYIHGSNYISAKKIPVQKIVIWFYKMLNVVPDYSSEVYPDWLDSIRKTGRRVIVFKWSGGVWPWQVVKASRDLSKQINEMREDVDVVSQSLGTWIAIKTAKINYRIKTITSVCGVYRGLNIKIPFIEIISTFDWLERLANIFLNFGLLPDSKKILIPHKRHNEFMDDFSLPHAKFKHEKFSDLILSVIEEMEAFE